MAHVKKKFAKVITMIVAAAMVLSLLSSSVFADDDTEVSLAAGTYTVPVSLSAYISAMGGIEFGDGLIDGDADLTVDSDGNYQITIHTTTSEVTIYSVDCYTFIDATDSKPGYYSSGSVVTAEYTVSEDTAENADGEDVNYVDSITFTLPDLSGSYTLWIYINSSVMGVQFCDGAGSGSSNNPGVSTPYTATLTVNFADCTLVELAQSGDDSTDDGSTGDDSTDDGSSGSDTTDDPSSGDDPTDDGSSDTDSSDDGSSGNDSSDDSSSGTDTSDDSSSDSGSAGTDDTSSGTDSQTLDVSSLSAGTYSVDVDLSAYISAMGGIEFGDGLVSDSSATLTVSDDGTYALTISTTKSSVTIYSVTCYTFIDASVSSPGYYDSDGNLVYIGYTLSSDTATDPDGNEVSYVDSLSFELDTISDTYDLYIYVNSSVMGYQFGNDSTYGAVLSVDWSTLTLISTEVEEVTTTSTTANIVTEASTSESAPETSAEVDENALAKKTLKTKETAAVEAGGKATYSLTVKTDDDGAVSASDITVAKKYLADDDVISEYGELTAGLYLDISLYLTVTDADGKVITDSRQITDTESVSYTITVTIPEDLINTDSTVTRTYYILRVHDGEAEILSAEYDSSAQTLTFDTDKFSTYAIVYNDSEAEDLAYGLAVGTYYPDATLSAYISAMGGVEFGEGLLDGVKVVVNEDGTYTITVYFTTSSVSIYTVTCDTFVDATDSTPGYYDSNGNLVYASYTLSSNTATDADGNAVHYVDSMTFTVSELQSSYYLYIYVNSSVMGVQFCDGSGSGSSNQPGVTTPYVAILTIDWSSIGATVESAPVTGQEDNLILWGALLVISAAGLVFVLRRKIRYNK